MAIHNSPVHVTTFLGRQSELHDLCDLLAVPDCRLLTLTGLGGIGKTRLSLALAEQIQDQFPDGVYFVPLQPLQSSDQIIASINTTLGVQADQKPLEQLLAWLHDKHLLLILDNFEHLTEDVDLLTDLLGAAPRVKLLITSRDALRLQSEWLRQIHGLEYPDADSIQPATDYSAVQLFVERARQRRGDLDIESHYPYIARICQIVEGMPLALELVAGWVKSLSCAEIVTELERGGRILRSRTQDMPTQHRSMEVVFDHSWHLLTDEEQAVLQSCSVFRGGCMWEAAEQVTGATLTVLTSLVEKSLLRHDPDSGRYDMHDLLRRYAAKQLDTAGKNETIYEAHQTYYADFVQQRVEDLKGRRQIDAVAEINADFENVRRAWNRAVVQQCTDCIQPMVEAVWLFCDLSNRRQDGQALFRFAEQRYARRICSFGGRN